jgi:two-component system, chemotaxis family, CheB/CheR fusion protein
MEYRKAFDNKRNKEFKAAKNKSANSEKQTADFYVVGIGASAGGLEAIEQFFSQMPVESNIAFVIIQHLSPDYKSYMSELLSRYTDMNVFQIENEMEIMPGCVYLNPPKYAVKISKGRFILVDQEPLQKINLSIDFFFDSLAQNLGEKVIGIILSGTGSDGTRGCRSIKEAGGIIIAQSLNTAKFTGMPKSVISTNICDYILSPDKMPDKLLQYIGQTSLIPFTEEEVQNACELEDSLLYIFEMLKDKYSVDFGLYKQSTVLRCIDRRMRINQITTLEEYYSYLMDNSEETESLYSSLLIGVTKFFRDSEAFGVIKNKVIPEIFSSKSDISPIRIWIAGCSTGEEAFSLAILLREYLDTLDRKMNIKIFATDIDRKAIEYASSGIYPDSIAEDVPLIYLNRYFIKKKDVYQLTKKIREMIIFSVHNVINNPPFHKIDLISCRNLLIYFQPELQQKILSTFNFALDTRGFLFLGTSETTGELKNYFSTVDSKWKVFRRKELKKPLLIDAFSVISTEAKIIPPKLWEDNFSQKLWNSWEIEDIYKQLIEECMPPSVVVDENGRLIQVCGDGDKYLKVPKGRVHLDIQKMVPKELSTALGTALSKVKKEKKPVAYANIKMLLGERPISVNLVVKPFITQKSGTLFLVVFEANKHDLNQTYCVEDFNTENELIERIADLEQELQYTKENLQTSIEEVETASEELQSSNEELLVSNEELHSTNEELQSVNEELIVVNNQYQHKIQELADLNNDMTNFLNSTAIGTIFLDSNLKLKKYTPAATKEINLMEQDIGRPINHISHNLINEDFSKEAKEVMNSLIPIKKEIQSLKDRWYIIRYAPYRTHENSIKGIVISMVDITERKKAEDDLRKNKELYERLIELSPFAILIIKEDKIQFANKEGLNLLQAKSIENLIGKSANKFLGLNVLQIINNGENNLNGEKTGSMSFEDKIIRDDGTVVYVEVISIPVSLEEENTHLVILRDITYRKLSEQLREDNERNKQLLEETLAFDTLKNDFFSNLSHELRTPLNVIMSTLQLLKVYMEGHMEMNKDRNIEKYINIMKQNCYRQLRLVNNMIDVTKIDSGFFEIRMENHNIVSLVENITLSVSEYIKNKSIDLIFDTDVEELIIACDPDNVERIILNLLSNAVKFTHKGGKIEVKIHHKGERILISVKDSGIGIPKDKQEIIFDRFRQVDKSLARNHEGSGIGLALVKSLVELHGGIISVQSEYGNGTEFIIELPLKVLPEGEIPVIEKYNQQNNVEKINIEFSDVYNLR